MAIVRALNSSRIDKRIGKLNAQPTTTAKSTTNEQGNNNPSNADISTPCDVGLRLVNQAWRSLPEVVRAEIVGMVKGATSSGMQAGRT